MSASCLLGLRSKSHLLEGLLWKAPTGLSIPQGNFAATEAEALTYEEEATVPTSIFKFPNKMNLL
jgi:hypothetical protein